MRRTVRTLGRCSWPAQRTAECAREPSSLRAPGGLGRYRCGGRGRRRRGDALGAGDAGGAEGAAVGEDEDAARDLGDGDRVGEGVVAGPDFFVEEEVGEGDEGDGEGEKGRGEGGGAEDGLVGGGHGVRDVGRRLVPWALVSLGCQHYLP